MDNTAEFALFCKALEASIQDQDESKNQEFFTAVAEKTVHKFKSVKKEMDADKQVEVKRYLKVIKIKLLIR